MSFGDFLATCLGFSALAFLAGFLAGRDWEHLTLWEDGWRPTPPAPPGRIANEED